MWGPCLAIGRIDNHSSREKKKISEGEITIVNEVEVYFDETSLRPKYNFFFK